ncbi:uncharacterized protein GIQ15_02482 [Arthroderma uncinatum]|uniref:uncharacterized protein n=1 Tax=Arthroderma uncinatum TaxID=74035 RepID=UPI00144A84B0|nr:uncharacterized protein GIQ15_02482 [Arthroderma uncinatum]KAF3483158.1 hypothetical protein GIQ15_02482 [Arthroderma uncinatum]
MDQSESPVDVLIVGGGPAGSKAAWELGRAHHRVVLFACDELMNDPKDVDAESSLSALNFLLSPDRKNRELLRLFRREASKELPVCVERRRITDVRRLSNGLFQAADSDGNVWTGRLLVLADGADEVMPDISGYQTCWQQQRILIHPSEEKHGPVQVAVLAVGELAELTMALHTVWQIRQFASSVRVYTHGDPELAQELVARVSPDAAITVEAACIQEIQPDADSSHGVVIQLDNGNSDKAYLYHRRAAQLKGSDPFARQLKLELTESGAIRISARVPYMTSMDGVYAGGDCASLGQRTLFKALAMGEGVAAAVAARLERGRWRNLSYEEDACGGPAGLAVALGLCRAVRTAVVFDSQTYRNSLTDHMHNVSTWDHSKPQDYRAAARRELTEGRYNTVTLADVALRKIWKLESGEFEATDAGGKTWRGRKLVLATGVKDEIPDVPGYADCWPRSIYHCLFCHGFEDRGAASVGVLAIGPTANPKPAEHLARLAHNLAKTVTIYTNGNDELAEQLRPSIEKDEWLSLDNRAIKHLHKTDGVPVKVELQDGTDKMEGFLVHAMKTTPVLNFEHNLELELSPQGTEFKTTPPFSETTTHGCFATGDCGMPIKAASMSMSHGSLAGVGVVSQLAFDEKA